MHCSWTGLKAVEFTKPRLFIRIVQNELVRMGLLPSHWLLSVYQIEWKSFRVSDGD